jgi:hypothetical protein
MSPVGIPLSEWSGSGTTERLRETIVELSAKTERQTTQVVRLTWVLVILTVVLVALTGVLLFRGA